METRLLDRLRIELDWAGLEGGVALIPFVWLGVVVSIGKTPFDKMLPRLPVQEALVWGRQWMQKIGLVRNKIRHI